MIVLLVSAFSTARAAAPAEVVVWSGRELGDAAAIGDFLGAGGALEFVMNAATHPVVAAWRDLGFRHVTFENLHGEDAPGRWLQVGRGADGAVTVDFDAFDRRMKQAVKNLRARPFVYVGNVPRALSSRPQDSHYAVYMPRDLREWQDFASRVARRLVEKHGLRGLYYHCLGEPDHIDSWKGSGSQDAAQRLREHVELYAATYRGVKSADPTALVGGPATMNWQETRWTKDPPFTLKDWIAELARYNARVKPAERVGLDFVSWQDYAWSSDRLSDGAEAVSAMLKENGFDPATPKVLGGSGWGSWSSDYIAEELKPHHRASHLLHSVIREFKDPRRRRFALALYYSFFFDDANIWEGPNYDLTLVRRVSLLRFRWDEKLHLTPMYAAFQMVKALAAGRVIEVSAPAPLEAMAARDDDAGTVVAALNNHTGETVQAVVVFRDLPMTTAKVTRCLQRIDETSSDYGRGLQEASCEELELKGRGVQVPATLAPHGSVLISLYPVR